MKKIIKKYFLVLSLLFAAQVSLVQAANDPAPPPSYDAAPPAYDADVAPIKLYNKLSNLSPAQCLANLDGYFGSSAKVQVQVRDYADKDVKLKDQSVPFTDVLSAGASLDGNEMVAVQFVGLDSNALQALKQGDKLQVMFFGVGKLKYCEYLNKDGGAVVARSFYGTKNKP